MFDTLNLSPPRLFPTAPNYSFVSTASKYYKRQQRERLLEAKGAMTNERKRQRKKSNGHFAPISLLFASQTQLQKKVASIKRVKVEAF
jgi:hypothetical protein